MTVNIAPTSGLSLRTRLTATIAVLTGLLALVSLVFGTSVLRDNVRSTALEQRTNDLDELTQESDFATGVSVRLVESELEAALVEEFGEAYVGQFPEVFESDGESFGSIIFDDALSPPGGFERVLVGDVEFLEREDISFISIVLARAGPDFFQELMDQFGTEDDQLIIALRTSRYAAFESSVRVSFDVQPKPADVILASQLFDGLADIDVQGDGSNGEKEESLLAYEIIERSGRRYGVIADVTEGNRALDAVERVLQVAALFITALAALATWLLLGRALRPVEAITNRVAEISSGNLDERVPVPPRQDEIGVLATTMNTMLTRLESSDRRRRQFVSDASHELRTPVAVLQSEAEVAERAPQSTTMQSFSGVVLTETHRLATMVEDLLSIARSDETDGSDLRVGTSVVDLDEIVLAESNRSRRLPVDRSAVSAGRIRAKSDEIGRAVCHLLDNAARYGHSKISVGVNAEEHQIRMWVEDDGPGIAPADRDNVFERFTRLDDARNRDQGGSGLGLAVVKSVVDASGGFIKIEESPLGGARFTLEWPAI